MDMLSSNVGTANVIATHRRGITPEEYANMVVKKIIEIGPSAHPAIRAQAEAYRNQMEKLIAHYMRLAVKSDRTTIWNALNDAGHPELANAIMEI